MMKGVFYIILFCCLNCFSQQTGQYTQFTFNKYGYNPAAAGTNINAKLELITGIRKQWIGFDNSPYSNFFSANYTFKPSRSYKRWHNVGVYLAQEKAGVFQNYGIYGSYTLHIPLTNKYNVSFGIFVGVKRFSIISDAISTSDPVYGVTSANNFYGYPDFIPGVRLYSKKMFLDISIQQVYKNRQEQGNNQIGHQSFLIHQLYVTYGKRFFLDNGFVIVPSLNIHSSFTYIPSLELNFMSYYRKRIGLGISVRNKDFISGIFQFRFFKNCTAGFSYDYSINRFNSVAPSSIEFMVGLTPMMIMDGVGGKHKVAKCPTFDF